MARAGDGDGVHLDLLERHGVARGGGGGGSVQHVIGAEDPTADVLGGATAAGLGDGAVDVPQGGEQGIVLEQRGQQALEPGGVGGGGDVEGVGRGLQGEGVVVAGPGEGGGQQGGGDGAGGDGGGLVASDQLEEGGVGELVVLDLVDQARQVRVRGRRAGVGRHDRSGRGGERQREYRGWSVWNWMGEPRCECDGTKGWGDVQGALSWMGESVVLST
nr:hypothetical protein CFP56_07531 [Quercus suber]